MKFTKNKILRHQNFSSNRQFFQEDISFTTKQKSIIVKTKLGYLPYFNQFFQQDDLGKFKNLIHFQSQEMLTVDHYLREDPGNMIFLNMLHDKCKNLHYDYFQLLMQIAYGNKKIIRNPLKYCENDLEKYLLRNRIYKSQLENLNRILVTVQIGQNGQILNRIIKIQDNIYEASIQDKKIKNNNTLKEKIKDFKDNHGLISLGHILDKENYKFYIRNQFQLYFNNESVQYQEQFFNLIYKYAQQEDLSNIDNIIDINCNNGMLGLIFKKFSKIKNIYAFDPHQSNVDLANFNNVQFNEKNQPISRYQANRLDLQKFLKSNQTDIYNLKQFDMMVYRSLSYCQFVGQSFIKQEDIIQDNLNALEFADRFLDKNGMFLFLYSTFGESIGLLEKNSIYNQIEQKNLKIEFQHKEKYSKCLEKDQRDPLKSMFKKSEVILFGLVKK